MCTLWNITLYFLKYHMFLQPLDLCRFDTLKQLLEYRHIMIKYNSYIYTEMFFFIAPGAFFNVPLTVIVA